MSLFDRPRTPVTPEEYRDWFDSDGRLVKEGIMRQRVFEGETMCMCMCMCLFVCLFVSDDETEGL